MPCDDAERLLLDQVRRGSAGAWEQLVARYEGRLLAFVEQRLGQRNTSEDVVQETFLGFLLALPHFDDRLSSLETFLFSIAAHKLTDVLRKQGRRPAVLVSDLPGEGSAVGPPAGQRGPSSIACSRERRSAEERVLTSTLRELIAGWVQHDELERLQCIELLFAAGWTNKQVAGTLHISEQAVANHKSFVMGKLKQAVRQATGSNGDLRLFGLTD